MSVREPAAGVFIDRLSKTYGQVLALSDISLGVAPGRFLVLLGPSGSGKSTLIRCLAGIEHPTGGRIEIGGRVVDDERVHLAPERRELAMVFQDFGLWPHMTVEQNVAFALKRRKLRGAAAAAKAREMLDRVALGGHAKRYPHQLSGGEQQRVALARALVAGPRLMLFDEPLSSLDANLRERLRLEIGMLVREQGTTAVYITHDQAEAFALGDEIGVLQDGRLVQHGPPEVIYRTPATQFVARFTGIAGSFHGRIANPVPTKQGAVSVLIGDGQADRELELSATAMSQFERGQLAEVLLRPTATGICRPGSRPAMLRGVILDAAFHARGYDYMVELSAEVKISGVFDRRRFDRGTVVELYLDPAGCMAYHVAAENRPPQSGAQAATTRGPTGPERAETVGAGPQLVAVEPPLATSGEDTH